MARKTNIRVQDAVAKEYQSLIDNGTVKMDAYCFLSKKYGRSEKTITRYCEKIVSNDEKIMSNDEKIMSNDEIVANICKLGHSNDYCTAFDNLQKRGMIPNTGATLSDGTKLYF